MKPSIILILLLVFFALIGAVLTIIIKCFFTEESKQFSLTWFYNIIMFFAEMVGLPIYYIKYCISQQRRPTINLEPEEIKEGQILLEIEEEKPKKKNILILILPCLCDTIGTFLANIGFAQLHGSIFQTLKGAMIMIITFLISKFFLKNKHILDHYIAISIALLGFILVGVSSFFGNLSTNSTTFDFDGFTLLGIGLIILSTFFNSIQLGLEEHYMRKYKFHPYFCIGYEGLFGFFINLIICIILSFISCGDEPSHFFQNICIKDNNNVWKVENILFSLTKIFTELNFAFFALFSIIFLGAFNLFSINITKYSGAMGRSIAENFRTFLPYIFFVLPILEEGKREQFNWFRLFGLILIFISLIIYYGTFKFDKRRIIKQKKNILHNIDEIEKNDILQTDSSKG